MRPTSEFDPTVKTVWSAGFRRCAAHAFQLFAAKGLHGLEDEDSPVTAPKAVTEGRAEAGEMSCSVRGRGQGTLSLVEACSKTPSWPVVLRRGWKEEERFLHGLI